MVSQSLRSLIARDFNCIVGPHEKMDGRKYADSINSRDFREFIGNASLIDLGYSGSKFT